MLDYLKLPSMSEDVALRDKTRQILLEYFCLMSDDAPGWIDTNKGTGRVNNNGAVHDGLNKSGHVGNENEAEPPFDNSPKKFKTHKFSSEDLLKLQSMLASHTQTNDSGKVYARSKSFESRKYYTIMRGKMKQVLNSSNTELTTVPLRDEKMSAVTSRWWWFKKLCDISRGFAFGPDCG